MLNLRVVPERGIRLAAHQHIAIGRAHNPVFRHAGARICATLDFGILIGTSWR